MAIKLNQFSEIIDQYDVFLFDQFGVLHDGQHLYDNTIAVLQQIQAQQKHTIIISNSGKRSKENVIRMEQIGISPKLFNGFVTSGELLFQYLSKNNQKKIGYLISRDGDRSALEGINIEITADLDQAEFFILTGLDAPKVTFEDLRSLFEKALAKNLTLLCANPDKTMIVGQHLYPAAGEIATWYENQGGTVEWFGKPYPAIYQFATQHLDLTQQHVLVIGDSLEHDIYGARLNHFDSLFITSGIHQKALFSCQFEASFKQLTEKYQAEPTYYLYQL